MMPLLVHVLLLQVTGAQLDGVFVGTQTCVQACRGDFVPEENFTLTLVNGSGTLVGGQHHPEHNNIRTYEVRDGFAAGHVLTDGNVHGSFVVEANATNAWGAWISFTSEKLFRWQLRRDGPPPPPSPPQPPPGTVVFDNPNYPACCAKQMSGVCLFRIPVVLHIPNSSVVLAFAEARLGGNQGCSDGSGPGLPMRRSTDHGKSFEPLQWIANDTQPLHVQLKDHIVLGMALYDPVTTTSFMFFTACYRKCVYTTTYVIHSKDQGVTWSSMSEGNLTEMLLAGDNGISMMQVCDNTLLLLAVAVAGIWSAC